MFSRGQWRSQSSMWRGEEGVASWTFQGGGLKHQPPSPCLSRCLWYPFQRTKGQSFPSPYMQRTPYTSKEQNSPIEMRRGPLKAASAPYIEDNENESAYSGNYSFLPDSASFFSLKINATRGKLSQHPNYKPLQKIAESQHAESILSSKKPHRPGGIRQRSTPPNTHTFPKIETWNPDSSLPKTIEYNPRCLKFRGRTQFPSPSSSVYPSLLFSFCLIFLCTLANR